MTELATWHGATTLVFQCNRCGSTIKPEAGIAAVDPATAIARGKAVRRDPTSQPPPRASWTLVHRECHDPTRDGDFTQSLSHMPTLGQLLNLTLAFYDGHIWARDTDWRDTVKRLLRAQLSDGP